MACIELSDLEIIKCKEYALSMSMRCRELREDNLSKVVCDFYLKKKIEVAAYNYLNNVNNELEPYVKDIKVNPPVFDIFDTRVSEQVKPVLNDPIKNAHFYPVMAQSPTEVTEAWGICWAFEVEDKLVQEPSIRDYMVLCNLISKFQVEVKTIINTSVASRFIGVPESLKLKRFRRFLYWDDLEDNI